MKEDTSLLDELQARIRELEDKVEALRISRRVLMNLIDILEQEKNQQVEQLESENQKLHRNNYRYARALMARNLKIRQLEEQSHGVMSGQGRAGHHST